MTKLRSRPLFIPFARPRPSPNPDEGGGPVTSMMVGEENSRPDPAPMTTLSLAEEGGGR